MIQEVLDLSVFMVPNLQLMFKEERNGTNHWKIRCVKGIFYHKVEGWSVETLWQCLANLL